MAVPPTCGEQYLRCLHKNGYPATAAERVKLNTKFYTDHKYEGLQRNTARKTVSRCNDNVVAGTPPSWTENCPELKKMFDAVVADYQVKYPRGKETTKKTAEKEDHTLERKKEVVKRESHAEDDDALFQSLLTLPKRQKMSGGGEETGKEKAEDMVKMKKNWETATRELEEEKKKNREMEAKMEDEINLMKNQVSNLSRSLDEANQAKEQMKTEMADRRGPDGELKKKYREMEKVVQMKDETIAQLQKVVRDKDDQIQIFVQMQKTINKLTGASSR